MENQEKIVREIIENQSFRKNLSLESFYWFSHIYFSHYIKYPTAEYHKRIYSALQNWRIKFVEIISFRGSAKSTIASLFYPIWATISRQSNFSILIADTFSQTKLHIYNIITELEHNKLLIKDWGPFEGLEEWTKTGIILPRYDSRIIGLSRGQKVRGMRHRQYRPKLIVIDDPEDLRAVRTKESRDETYRWFLGEVIPAGDEETKYVLIGNLLHRDSLLSRIKNEIVDNVRDGRVEEYAFFDEKGRPRWLGKFKNKEDIEKEKKKYDYRTWQREFLLRLIPEEGQEIKDDWIQHYDKIEGEEVLKGTGIDLAISKKDTADYTAMVSGILTMVRGQPKIYILPNPINERLSGFETTEKARIVSLSLGNQVLTPLWVEDVSYQRMQIESMERVGLPVEGIKVTKDKRARLRTIAGYIQNGTVLFPKKGCEDLIIQLTGFGVEAHDDLVDAFVILVKKLMSFISTQPKITIF